MEKIRPRTAVGDQASVEERQGVEALLSAPERTDLREKESFFENPVIDIEFANEKLARIERYFVALSGVMGRITPQLFKEDRSRFADLESQAQEQMLKIRALLVSFEAKVKSEYTTVAFSSRVILWLLSFVSARARTLRAANRNALQTRDSLLKAVEKYDELVEEQNCKIDGIRHARVNRLTEIELLKNQEYKKLLLLIPQLHVDIANAENDMDDDEVNRFEARLDGVNERIEQLRDMARQVVMNELGDEDN